MNTTGYATISIDGIDPPSTADGAVGRTSFTSALGCTATTVDGYRLPSNGVLTLSATPEQICIPVDTSGSLHVSDSIAIPPHGVGRIPAGIECLIRCETATALFVISAPAEAADESVPTAVALDECDFAVPSTSDIATARLTASLGCAGLKINARLLEAGQWVPYHTEGKQEELFLPIDGPATMRLASESYETPVGTVTRVAPNVPRSAVNDGDTNALWLMIGAPPTGGPTQWDPGAKILE